MKKRVLAAFLMRLYVSDVMALKSSDWMIWSPTRSRITRTNSPH